MIWPEEFNDEERRALDAIDKAIEEFDPAVEVSEEDRRAGAQAVETFLAKVDQLDKEGISAEHFVRLLHLNADNEKLDDAAFRQFVRNTLPIVRSQES